MNQRFSGLAPVETEAGHFDLLLRQADVLARSTILPAAYRGKSNDIIAAGLAGRVFGWDVMTSLNNYHVIEGKASLRPEAMLGLVRRHGHSVKIELTNTEDGRTAIAVGERVDNGDTHEAIFSEVDAKNAGLANKKNWNQYLDAMLTWRAVSALCRVLFPDVVMGAGYVAEELGAPLEVYEDPLADPLLSFADAKRELLGVCQGDKEQARSIWGKWEERNEGASGIRQGDLEMLLAEAKEADVITAEVIDDVDE